MKNLLFNQNYAGTLVALSFVILIFTFLVVVWPWLAIGAAVVLVLMIINSAGKRRRHEEAEAAYHKNTWGF